MLLLSLKLLLLISLYLLVVTKCLPETPLLLGVRDGAVSWGGRYPYWPTLLLKATVEFMSFDGFGGVVCKVNFMSNPTILLFIKSSVSNK